MGVVTSGECDVIVQGSVVKWIENLINRTVMLINANRSILRLRYIISS